MSVWTLLRHQRSKAPDEPCASGSDVFRGLVFAVPLALFGWLLIVLALVRWI